jgi:hypothetical protein
MTVQVPTRLDELYDRRRRRAEIAAQIVLSYTTVPQDADDAEWADDSAADLFGDRR